MEISEGHARRERRKVWHAEGRNLFWAPSGNFEVSLTSLPFALDNCISFPSSVFPWSDLCRVIATK